MTSDLVSRITEHREKVHPKSFAARYNLTKLVYYEGFLSIEEAIEREKQLKAGPKKQKVKLIEAMNPLWKDLFDEIKYW